MDKEKLANRATTLCSARDRIRDRETIKAQAEIDAIQREYNAYCEGVQDMLHDVLVALKKEQGE